MFVRLGFSIGKGLLSLALSGFFLSAAQAIETPAEEGLAVFLESLDIIRQRAVFSEKSAARAKLMQESLRALLKQHDPYSQYLNPDEYRRFKASQQAHYLGLGMELEQTPAGDILCFPYSGSPAQKAGIKANDRLLAINGETVTDKPLYALSTLAAGKSGAAVGITVASGKDQPRLATVILAENHPASVITNDFSGIPVLKIAFFADGTPIDLISRLDRFADSPLLILDVRDNPGGDFYAALEAADLFVPEGKPLAYAETADKRTPYTSSGRKKYLHPKLFIWQNHGSASAAEVFTAALTENGRAVSIGPTSYGKGSKQSVIELGDGSALILTTEYLTTPKGYKFNGKGLAATYPLPANIESDLIYRRKVQELIKITRPVKSLSK